MDPHVLASISVLKAGFQHQRTFDKAMVPHDLSYEQFNVLKILELYHPKALTLKQVQEKLLNQTPNTTRLVEKLRLKGFVSREQNKINRREVDILLTAAGKKKLRSLKSTLEEMDQMLRKNLSKKESLELARLLKKFMGEDGK